MRTLLLLCAIVFAFASCKNDSSSASEATVENTPLTTTTGDSNTNNNAVTASEPEDTVNVAKLAFEENEFDFGEVMDGEIVTHTYKFKNTGKVPLVISNAKATCGCTVPQWPKEPIAVGDSGEIVVEFKSKGKTRNGKESKQSKPVTITANTYPKNTVIYLKGTVLPDPNAAAANTASNNGQ